MAGDAAVLEKLTAGKIMGAAPLQKVSYEKEVEVIPVTRVPTTAHVKRAAKTVKYDFDNSDSDF